MRSQTVACLTTQLSINIICLFLQIKITTFLPSPPGCQRMLATSQTPINNNHIEVTFPVINLTLNIQSFCQSHFSISRFPDFYGVFFFTFFFFVNTHSPSNNYKQQLTRGEMKTPTHTSIQLVSVIISILNLD